MQTVHKLNALADKLVGADHKLEPVTVAKFGRDIGPK